MNSGIFSPRAISTAFLLAALVVFALLQIFGFYWEDTMTLHPAVMYGCISSPPYEAWFGDALIFQVPVLAYLSEWFPQLPVVGLWALLVLTLSYGVWLLLAYGLVRSTTTLSAVAVWFGALVCVVPLLSVSLIYIHFSRLSILLVSAVLLWGFVYYHQRQKYPPALLVLFVFAFCIRVSTGGLTLALGTVFFLLQTKSIKTTWLAVRCQWLVAVLCIGAMLVYKYTSHNTGVEVEQTYEYVVSDSKAMVPLQQMHTTQDSVRYQALINYFLISDTAQIGLGFIKKVATLSQPLHKAITLAECQHLAVGLAPVWQQYSILVSVCLLIVLSVAWYAGWRLILWVQFAGAVVVALALKVSMPEYFLLPWGTVIFLYSLHWSLPQMVKDSQRFALGVGMLVLASISITHIQKVVKKETDYNRNASQYLKNIAAISIRHQTPVIWDYGFLSFPSSILSRKEMEGYKYTVYQTQTALLHYAFGQQRCIEKTGCSPLNWRCMNEEFNRNKDKYCFVMEEKTAAFLKQYYSTLYHLDFNLVKEQPTKEITPDNFVFRLQ